MNDYKEPTGERDDPAYHRNGVSGCGFKVFVDTQSETLGVKFNQEDKSKEVFIEYPFSLFQSLMDSDCVGEPINIEDSIIHFKKAVLFGTQIVCAYLSDNEPFIGIYDDNHWGVGFATFNWEKILDGEVRFFYNSYRGDVQFNAICEQMGVEDDFSELLDG